MKKVTNINEFIEKARKIHGDKYDYSKVNYINSSTKVCIICPIHGEFWQKPNDHLPGKGCKYCGIESRTQKKTLSNKTFIERACEIHNNFYSYEETNYVNAKTEIKICCPEHGYFYQLPYVHLNGFGCAKCSNRYHYTNNEFIEKVKKVHDNKYDYSKTEYINSHTKICVICPEHGEFWQTASDHLQGKGCAKCSKKVSKGEIEIKNYLEENGLNVETRVRNIIPPYELDLYIPDKRIAIEYDGLIWHSDKFGKDEKYHLRKTELCEEKGIQLIHIFEDEWKFKKEEVLTKLNNSLNFVLQTTFDVKNCFFKETKTCYDTIIEYMYCNRQIGKIVIKEEKRKVLINEITYENNDICKTMIDYVLEKYKHCQIILYLDRRWYTDERENIFKNMGFVFNGTTSPSSYMVKHDRRTENGENTIYDCGQLIYIYINS